MVKNINEAKSSLKNIEKSLDKAQVLTMDKQCDIKGGCSNCEDNRRPPRADGSTTNSGWGNGWGNR